MPTGGYPLVAKKSTTSYTDLSTPQAVLHEFVDFTWLNPAVDTPALYPFAFTMLSNLIVKSKKSIGKSASAVN